MRSPVLLVAASLAVLGSLYATETENIGIQILPAPGKVKIDGRFDDWDLTGGVFVCSDVENQRDKFSLWLHAMYDTDNLYLLARWNDETPLNNPGSSKGDYGFAGDCLQFRIITCPDDPKKERTSHWTCWQDRDKLDVMDVAYGKQFNQGGLKDAQTQGAAQEFLVNPDGKGYVQELSVPWKLLVSEGVSLKAGDRIQFTVEPNYTIGINGRLSLKDIFKPGITPDRVFTFMASGCWGYGTLESKGKLTPRPLRLADAREFPVHMERGLPAIDWTGLVKSKEPKGFVKIRFTLPEDGYVSLNIKDAEGKVVRQLLTCNFYPKGEHVVLWDGLTTMNWRTPGEPVPPGSYVYEAIWHKGIGLRLVGWAANSGNAPWDSTPTSNWGGDHGVPVCCAADADKVYLGWSGAEAGKALLAVNLQGDVVWKNSRGGMAGAELVAVDAGTVYVQNWGGNLYRLESKQGGYTVWAGTDSADIAVKSLFGTEPNPPERADALAARDGKLYLSFTKAGTLLVLDGQSGKLLKRLAVQAPGDLEAASPTRLYVISEGKSVLALNPETGETKPVVTGLSSAVALALDKDGRIYVGERDPDNQVRVFTPDGKPALTIGRKGGRTLIGKWTPDGMAFISGLTVDAEGKLWVAEADMTPKRFSVWDTRTGAFVKEFFGPTTYGALGGAINPVDPYLMVGQGCEWRIDPKTGRSSCLGCFTRDGMEVSRFAVGSNGRLYLFVAANWAFNTGPLRIYERIGDADYKLRTLIYHVDDKGNEIGPTGHGQPANAKKTMVWADENGDGQRQPGEISGTDGELRFSGWYMNQTPDLSLYAGKLQFKCTGFTTCGAPKYDLAKPITMPIAGLGSADGRLVFTNGDYGVNNGWNKCYDIASGKLLWTYPDNFVGVHGSHNAVPAEVGMIRGSFGACAAVKLPPPIGNAWIIATNVGEWHILTEGGYYLTRLFQPDPMKFQWPERAVPGALLDNVPCGMGGEDFGGSATLAQNGKLYLQAGKTGFWNVEVVGLDTVKSLKGGTVKIKPDDVERARTFRDQYLQEAVGTRRMTLAKMTPNFTGNLDADFKGAEIASFKKQDDAAVRVAAAWDDRQLYLGYDVVDSTPWVNGADAPEFLYAHGDTVDFQLGTDPKADKNRTEAVLGDLRLSIGSFQGKPTAVIYRRIAKEKHPKVFSSGVIKKYEMQSVTVVADAKVSVKKLDRRYIVEAAIPLAALDLEPSDGLALRGDFGVTHGDPAGNDTVLRTYWNNQHTGIVNDEVFELMLEPKNWGELIFKQ